MGLKDRLKKKKPYQDDVDEMEIDDSYYTGSSENKSREEYDEQDEFVSDVQSKPKRKDSYTYDSDEFSTDDDLYGASSSQRDERKKRADDYDSGFDSRFADDGDGYYETPYRHSEEVLTYDPTEPEDEEEEEERTEEAELAHAGVMYFLPGTYTDDNREIADGLREKHMVMVDVSNLAGEEIVRLFDFARGLAMGLNGKMFRLNATTVVLAPEGVDIDPDAMNYSGDAEETSEESDEDGETV